ncbi:sensor histidine kinase [Reichenbachiella versicolor]|uniref:sensor histidine kinase n=1 Tax=Reichenbachiella versicolor TaxID=1821036 RepID=UPI0013A55E82|nr:HAMP domain-containing sensor histidine kinase [Reichenbachiella versicolor]
MTLINEDQMIRRDEVNKAAFYNKDGYKRVAIRNKKFDAIIKELQEVNTGKIAGAFELQKEIEGIINQINRYNQCQQRLLALYRMKGFKDFGLEGQMRRFAHELENHPSELELSELLTLRRHEKDYILRKDLAYVNLLNQKADKLKKKFKKSKSKDGQELFVLLENYQLSFQEIVKTEQAIGNENYGAIWELNEASFAVTSSFQHVSTLVNAKTDRLITALIRNFVIFVFCGISASIILGYFSAGFVTKSIKSLAATMQQAQLTNFKEPNWKPSNYATKETKSLYHSYIQLLYTIRNQFDELERQTTQMIWHNEELIKINNLLESSQKSLEESNQVKDKFFSIIGHDLRGPMSNLTMSLQILSESMNTMTKEEVSTFSSNILASADAISVLLDNLLMWAKTQTDSLIPKFECVNLKSLVNSIQSLQSQRLTDKSISFLNELDDDLEISADRNMIDLVLRNLLDNAIKFTSESGFIKVGSEISTSHIKIMVKDSGIGIEPEAQSTLFTSLVKKRSQGTQGEKGTGLGLMLAYDFIRKHGGELQVSSKLNEGSTFIISLPIKQVCKLRAIEVV